MQPGWILLIVIKNGHISLWLHGFARADSPSSSRGYHLFDPFPFPLIQIRITHGLKVHIVKAMVFPGVMHGYESWTVKKVECRKIDAFELRCWRSLLRVPWIVRRSNQSILKEVSPENSFEGLELKLKLQYFGYLMQRTDSLEKILMLGKIDGRRRRRRQRMR